MILDYVGITFTAKVGVRDHLAMKRIPGTRHKAKEDLWLVPATWPAMLQMASIFGNEIEATATARTEALRLQHQAKHRHCRASHLHMDPRLYPFQQDGVSFLRSGSSLLGDEMGLGKTIQALQATMGPALVVTTNSMTHKWASECAEWGGTLEPLVLEGGPKARAEIFEQVGDRTLLIMNWEKLILHSRQAAFGSVGAKPGKDESLNEFTWATTIADEAHRAKDPMSQQTRALWAVGQCSDRRIAMTGTPMADSPDDLWSIMHFVSPEEWPTRGKFRERYCEMRDNGFGIENVGIRREMMAEFDAIFQPRFLRRTKTEVLPDLPDKTFVTVPLEMAPKQKAAYKSMAEEFIALIDGDLLVATDILSQLGRLRQLASATPVIEDGEVVAMGAPSNKLDALEDILSEKRGVVVFAESRKLIEFIGSELEKKKGGKKARPPYKVGYITGAYGAAMRQRYVDAFQAGELDVMLCTMAGKEGVTLTRADTLVYVQLPQSNIDYLQSQDRIHRIGQESNVTVIILSSEGTADETVAANLERKNDRLQQVVRDNARVALYGGSDF